MSAARTVPSMAEGLEGWVGSRQTTRWVGGSSGCKDGAMQFQDCTKLPRGTLYCRIYGRGLNGSEARSVDGTSILHLISDRRVIISGVHATWAAPPSCCSM